MRHLFAWLVNPWKRIWPPFARRPSVTATQNRSSRPIVLRRFDGEGDPPPLMWKPSHPRTASRFKAHLTCAAGHGVTLRDHAVGADGSVRPSVVCMAPGCSFHEFVRLDGWSGGVLRR